jgi:hypothetical protein
MDILPENPTFNLGVKTAGNSSKPHITSNEKKFCLRLSEGSTATLEKNQKK